MVDTARHLLTQCLSLLNNSLDRSDEVQQVKAEIEAYLATPPDERTVQLQELLAQSATLTHTFDEQVTLAELVKMLVPVMADWCAITLVDQENNISVIHESSTISARLGVLRQIREQFPVTIQSASAASYVLRTGQSLLISHVDWTVIEERTENQEHLDLVRQLGTVSAIAVPIQARGRIYGVMSLNMAESGRCFGQNDLAIAEELGLRTGIALDNGRLFRETQAALQSAEQTESRLRTILENMPVIVTALNTDGTYAIWNREAELITGYSKSEIIDNTHARELLYPDPEYRERTIQEWQVFAGNFRHWERNIVCKDGTKRVIAWSSISKEVVIPGLSGWGIGVDVTQQKYVEEENRRQADYLQIVADASQAFSEISLDYQNALNVVVRKIAEIIGDICAMQLLSEDRQQLRLVSSYHRDPEIAEFVRQLLESQPLQADETMTGVVALTSEPLFLPVISPEQVKAISPPEYHVYPDRFGLYSMIIVPIRAHGRVIGTLYVSRDKPDNPYTTDDLKLVQELADRAGILIENAQLYAQVKQAVEQRDEFLSVAAHELKTPVTSMRGFAQMLMRQISKRGAVDTQQLGQALSAIDKQSVKLAKLVNQLLDVSRLEAGRLTLSKEPTDIVGLAQSTIDTIQKNTDEHSIRLSAPEALIAMVDALRLEQVLMNLLDNAVKFSPKGGSITVGIASQVPDTVHIIVQDAGIGVPLERRNMLFNRFYQAHAEGYLGGMGLGLFISSQIIALHGGTIHAEFPDTGGTRMVINLPVQQH